MVDLVSNGRLDLGIGAGYRVPEYELYGVSLERRHAQTDGRAQQLRRLWAPGGVTHCRCRNAPRSGWATRARTAHARRPARRVTAQRRRGAVGALPGRAGLVEAGHDPSIARMAGGIQAWVSEDPDAD